MTLVTDFSGKRLSMKTLRAHSFMIDLPEARDKEDAVRIAEKIPVGKFARIEGPPFSNCSSSLVQPSLFVRTSVGVFVRRSDQFAGSNLHRRALDPALGAGKSDWPRLSSDRAPAES
jgi:hypothetical protein